MNKNIRKRFLTSALTLSMLLTSIGVNEVFAGSVVADPDSGSSQPCVELKLSGSYYETTDEIYTALSRINQFRYEACEQGLPDPRDPSRQLTMDDYVELQWSSDMETIAKIRAAESEFMDNHERLNGELWNTLTVNGVCSNGEALASTIDCDSFADALDSWYGQKNDWQNQVSEASRDYGMMINPNYSYVGMACFYTESGKAVYSVAGEFMMTDESVNDTMSGNGGETGAVLSVAESYISLSFDAEKEQFATGDTASTSLWVTVNANGYSGKMTPVGTVNYSSSDSGVAEVDSEGNITAVSDGSATITASIGGKTASVNVTVQHQHSMQYVDEKEATCQEDGVKGHYECSACGKLYLDEAGQNPVSAEELVIKGSHQTVLQNQKEATCKEEGYTGDEVCENCGTNVKTGESIPKTEHQTEVQNQKEATCKEEGYTGDEVCKVCGTTVKTGEATPTTEHTPGEAVKENEVAATCKEEGSYDEVVYCSICNAEISRTKVSTPKAEHDTELQNQKEATCKEEGYTGDEVCKVCGTTVKTGEATPTTEHKPGEAVKENEVAATCKEEGSYDEVVYCSICNAEISRTKVSTPKAEHQTELKNQKEATCKEEGYTGDEVCKNCGTTVKTGETIPKTEHQTELQNQKEATCKEEGYSGDEVCKVCGTTVKTGESVPKTEHTPGEAVKENEVAATCKEEGAYDEVVYCSVCNAEISRTKVSMPKAEHQTEVQNQKEATCKEEGYTGDEVCKVCGTTVKTGESIPKSEHDTEVQNQKEATCKEEGYSGDEVCKVCGTTVKTGEATPTTEHTPGEAVKENEVAATCKEEGSYDEVVYCSICNAEISRTKVSTPKAEHDTELQNQKEATCKEEGYTGDEVCKVCGTTVKTGETIAKTEHQTEVQNQKEATCKEEGYTGDEVCKVCGTTVKTGEATPTTEHKPGEAVKENEVAATCKEEGSYDEVVYCSVCSAEISRTKVSTPKAEHDTELQNQKEATCKEEGYTGDEVCKVCGTTVKTGESIPKTEHQTELQNQKEATCKEEGYTGDEVCKVCGTTVKKGEAIAKTDHKKSQPVKENEKAATCKEQGSYDNVVYCEICKAELSRETVNTDTGDHTPVLQNKKEATCNSEGYTGDSVCSICQVVLETGSVIPMKEHSAGEKMVENKTEASCTSEGSYEEVTYCKSCGKELSRNTIIIPKLEHTAVIKNAKAATKKEDGYTGDTVCEVCGIVIKTGQVIPAELENEIIDGAHQTWILGSKDGISITANGSYSEFKEIKVDSTVLDPSNYTVKENSSKQGIVIELKPEYLSTLAAGAYKLDIVWESGSASTSFIVARENSGSTDTDEPGTGDINIMAMASCTIIIFAIIFVICLLIKKKGGIVND